MRGSVRWLFPSLDVSFLVDCVREARRQEAGAATHLLEGLPEEEGLGISLFVLPDEALVQVYGELSRNSPVPGESLLTPPGDR